MVSVRVKPLSLLCLMSALVVSGCQVVSETTIKVSNDGSWRGELVIETSEEAAEWVKTHPGDAERAIGAAAGVLPEDVEAKLLDGRAVFKARLDNLTMSSESGESLGFSAVSVTDTADGLVVEIKTTTPHRLRNALADGASASGDPEGVSRTMWRLWTLRFVVECPGDARESFVKTQSGERASIIDGRRSVFESNLSEAGEAVLYTECGKKSSKGYRVWLIAGLAVLASLMYDRKRRYNARLSTRG